MRPILHLASFLVVSGVALAVHATPDGDPARVEPREQTRAVTEGLGQAGHLRAGRINAFRLAAPGQAELAQIGAAGKGTPLQIGIARAVRDLQSEASTHSALQWEQLDDGTLVADLSVTSQGAAALRAGLRVTRLPDTATLRFTGPNDEKLFETTGRAVNEALGRNADAGEKGEDARSYWSPVIEGDTVVVEIELAAGTDPVDLSIAVPRVSHLVASAGTAFATPTTIGRSASCEVDAMCSSGWSNQMNAVAEMIFTSGSGTYLCTGTLLADQDPSSAIPYFLTANHCVNSQSVATSLVTYWFYRSSACNSGTPGTYQQLTGGATLLYNTSNSDTSFMRLNNIPPQGTFYAGYYTGTVPGAGASITALHQPAGDLLKISQGSIGGYISCTAPNSTGSFSCSDSTASASTFYDVFFTSGITEGGSSGSGLFLGNGYVIGQLYGGSSSCSGGADDAYGRFDVAFNAALKNWLLSSSTLNVTLAGAGSGVVGSSPAGISCGSACSATFPSGTAVSLAASAARGSTFAGWSGACTGTGGCNMTLNSATNVTATFVQGTATLSVSTTGGTGTITSSPAGISCGATCAHAFPYGTAVTLTATPAVGMEFKGWSGSCSGMSCTVTLTGPMSVTASFGAPVLTSDARLTNISTRGAVLGGADVMIGGLVIDGTTNKTVVVRARGPSLTAYGITGALANPTLTLVRSSDQAVVASNDDWGSAPNAAQIAASGFAPGDPLESAILVSLGPGAYTAVVSGSGGATGVGIVEVYEVDHPEVRLINMSTRGKVMTGEGVMIGGFAISGTLPRTVVITAKGPSLAAYGIANPLANPTLTLVRASDQAMLATNDDWTAAPNAAQISASGFAPSNALESAILITLNPGVYTAIVSGAGGATGTGIFEIYPLP